MFYESGNQILNSLETRFGKLALPQLIRWLAIFWVLCWGLAQFSPDLVEWLYFDRAAIFSGEIWRLFSWALLPPTGLGNSIVTILFTIIMLMFSFFLSNAIEGHWDSFRVNVYVIASILSITLACFLPTAEILGLGVSGFLFSQIFLAFACLFPDHTLMLYGIIPVKAKWLGWVTGAILVATVLLSPNPFLMGLIVVVSFAPFLITFVPGFFSDFRERSQSAVRKHKFEAAKAGEGDAFHECENCGATDNTNPEREFRVTAEGQELCEKCLGDSPKTE